MSIDTMFSFLWTSISVPVIVTAIIAILALYGFVVLILKTVKLFRLLWVLRSSSKDFESKQKEWLDQFQDQADIDAKEIIDKKCQKVWRSISPGKMLDVQHLKDDTFDLIKQIAAVYYPSSNKPEFEVTILELLSLNQRISAEIDSLLEPFPLMHSISISTILETKAMWSRTQSSLTRKGLKTGGKVAQNLWMAFNALKPQYWINRALFKGAGEVVTRKILSAVYRIVGTEAIRVYKMSSKSRVDPSFLKIPKEKMADDLPESESENTKEAIEPEIVEGSFEDIQQEKFDARNSKDHPEDETMQEAQTESDEKTLYKSVAKTLSQFLEGSLQLWDKLVSKESVFKTFEKKGYSVSSLCDIQEQPLEVSDEIVEGYITKSEWYTAAEGAATGMGGFFLLSADAVSLLALQLRTIQQIGYCYGFDSTLPEEKLFALKLLTEAYMHPGNKQKKTVVDTMRSASEILKGSKTVGLIRQRLFVTGISKAAEKIGIKLGGRYSTKLIPVLGAVAGGYINKKITREIMDIAKTVYQERRKQLSEEK